MLLAILPILFGLEPLRLTLLSMALTALILPLAVVPFLVLMNDQGYLGEHTNGWVGNTVVIITIGLAFVLALVTITFSLAADL